MLEISRPIIVEGKYDKIKLSSVVRANIITTNGFGIFSAAEKAALIRRLAEPRGVIVLTDSDGAGLVIRNYIKSLLPPDKVINIYIPQVKGKERRKTAPSKAGLLGVEGIDAAWFETALAPFADGPAPRKMALSKADFYALGLSGGATSAERRRRLARALSLPDNLSANALLEAVNLLVTEEEFSAALERLNMQSEETT